jgi:hypothetical protein
MTVEDFRRALDELSDGDFAVFQEKFGGGSFTRERRVRDYADNSDHEGRICYLLQELGVTWVRTEQEKTTRIAQQAAASARRSAQVAIAAVIVAVLTAIISGFTIYSTLYRMGGNQ